MRRVVVPLDGTPPAEDILPDARRLAGPDGELILVHNASIYPYYGVAFFDAERRAVTTSRGYLREVADRLRAEGMKVETETLVLYDTVLAVDDEATKSKADMIAVATRGRAGLGRLFRGSVAWDVLAHSRVPVLLHHMGKDGVERAEPMQRRILVPLDGSTMAESAVPLAAQLAREWSTGIDLAQVIFTLATATESELLGAGWLTGDDLEPSKREAEAYLREIAGQLTGDVRTHILYGQPVKELVAATRAWETTDIVMASHGRTGLSRMILGSVANSLIHRLSLPIIVIPALTSERALGGRAESSETSGDLVSV